MTDTGSRQRTSDRTLRRYRSALASIGLALLSPVTPATAQETKITQFPLAIFCEYSGTERVFYISRLQADGVAVYQRMDGVSGLLSLSGPATVVGGDAEPKGSCGGKTLEELRSAGRTVEFR